MTQPKRTPRRGLHATQRLCTLLLFVLLFGCTDEAEPVAVFRDGLQAPESVVHDTVADVYLVSNINGSGLAADGNGFISKLDPEGEIIALKWIDGSKEGVSLDAPKGLAIAGDTLFVADLQVVRTFDRKSGKPLHTIPIENASFLNDVAVAPSGVVLVSDTGIDGVPAIYEIDGQKVRVVARGEALGAPNGLLVDANGLWVADFGSSTVRRLSLDGKQVDAIQAPAGKLDGLLLDRDGNLVVSSWSGSALYARRTDGKFYELKTELPEAADIAYDKQRNRLLVPQTGANSVVVLAPPETQ